MQNSNLIERLLFLLILTIEAIKGKVPEIGQIINLPQEETWLWVDKCHND